jgi:hypothetical protein
MSEKPGKNEDAVTNVKKPYTKPVLITHGSVEKITMKGFGPTDGILFAGEVGSVGIATAS